MSSNNTNTQSTKVLYKSLSNYKVFKNTFQKLIIIGNVQQYITAIKLRIILEVYLTKLRMPKLVDFALIRATNNDSNIIKFLDIDAKAQTDYKVAYADYNYCIKQYNNIIDQIKDFEKQFFKLIFQYYNITYY